MGDLISRQDAIKAIEKLNIPEDMCVFEILSHITLAIETLPSAERDYKLDEVVRCKYCKNWDKSWQTIEGCHYCGMVDKQTEEYFFCGDGEREEE